MINQDDPLSLSRQCQLLDLSRSSVYYQPVAVSEEELTLMRRLDELHLRYPFYGTRRLTTALNAEGYRVNRKRVQRLMRLMGLTALYPKPKTSQPARGAQGYPYLLTHLTIDQPNQVWCADITYIPMAHGFIYLIAIMDWHSRKVLSWRLSNTLDSQFCVEALRRYGAMGDPISSTPTRARSLPATTGLKRSKQPLSASVWMAKAAGSITCSSSDSGAA